MVDYPSASGTQPVTGNSDLEPTRESFARFYSEHRSLGLVILRLALGGTGIEPEDVASCMWVKIWEKWRERGPLVEAPKAFVRKCARNAAIDALRTRTDLLADVDELDGLAAHRWADDAQGGPETVRGMLSESDQGTQQGLLIDPRLFAAVQELTPIERLVILTWIETFPPPTSTQIARTLKIPSASTVRGHRMRALKKLRDIFDTVGEEEGGGADEKQ
jgi:DNA-directed RNA polymerase specialized sigma24 family protein